MNGLDWQTLTVPFVGGLQQKTDPRALQPPGLTRAVDVSFDEHGNVSLRKPFTNLSTDGLGSTVRRIHPGCGDELLVFTKTELLSYSPSSTTPWKSRGTHLAIKVEEATKNATTGDQIDPDRAELANCIVRAWTDNSKVYVVAEDKTTGATITGPTIVNETGNHDRPRVLALATKILVFFNAQTAAGLKAIAIDPADPATGIASVPTTVVSAADTYNLYYDAVKIPSADSAIVVSRLNPTTSYMVKTVTSALAVTSSVKARTCDGPIAVSVDPTGATAQVFRANGTNLQGDRLTVSTLADAATGQAIGTFTTSCRQIACAHRSVQNGGAYRCYAFWSGAEVASGTDWLSSYNYVDTAGSIGTAATLARWVGIGARAFDYNGEVYVWGVFAGESSFSGASPSAFNAQLQNTYFLYRDDATIHAKAAFDRGGGLAPTIGRLPGVALTSGSTTFSWCSAERRVIPIGTTQKGFDKRSPREVTFTFDSDDARRVARLGRTLYIAGGEILQYDGRQLVECGFHIYPWYFGAIEIGTGNLADGNYALKVTWKYDNAQGEVDRSTTATAGTVQMTGGVPSGISIVTWKPLFTTRKTAPAVVAEVWRTQVAPSADAPFYLVTSKDPSATSNPNRYIVNDPTAFSLPTFNDEFSDATLITKEAHYENGDVLENLAPPAATIIIATDTRLFLGGVGGDPDRVWYSKARGDGEVAAFNDVLTIDVPRDGGRMTALAIHEETLVVFRERAIYALPGDGLSNVGQGQNYGPARTIATDVGAISHETVARTPLGTIFKSSKGWYLLRGWGVEYIGGSVSDYDSETIVAVQVVEKQHQVRVMSSSRCLVWDYLAPNTPWAEWSISSAVGACMWNGTHTIAEAASVATESTTYSGVDYGMDVETTWIKLGDLQGYGRVRWFEVLGEYRGLHTLKLRIATNYRDYTAPGDSSDFAPSLSTGDPLQVRKTPRHAGSIQSIKVRLTTLGNPTNAVLSTGSGASWSSGGTVATSGAAWTASVQARAVGTEGHSVIMNIYTSQGIGCEVRDDHYFDGTNWIAQPATVGVRVGVGATVAEMERAISDTSRYISVTSGDINSDNVVTDNNTAHVSTVFAGGTDDAPTSEQLKLTGLSFELGFKPGLFKRLPASQKR